MDLSIYNVLFAVLLCVKCTSACRNGWYGDDCKWRCPSNCRGNVCDVTQGTCFNCTDGWTGNYCDQLCPQGHHGPVCKYECGHCKGGVVCHHVTGHCVNGCEPGYTGQTCTKACPNGYYGEECEKFCKVDSKCNPVTGECCGCTELLKQVQEKGEEVDKMHKTIIGLAVALAFSLLCCFPLGCWCGYCIFRDD
ncbi:multiple epidermal growth factor-like domains protein 10 isoform X2 [Ostrea edulis]|uniref:multiple epidermal growth factor-like domains protein 10 isoform X2 n=1 Tax=Ostrea edulis TaxID=37623 RepID=UPI0024AFD8F2|nr:multiple epidermal growth factor-like domains protein 10 isoform X2 [Ostrea edulis]